MHIVRNFNIFFHLLYLYFEDNYDDARKLLPRAEETSDLDTPVSSKRKCVRNTAYDASSDSDDVPNTDTARRVLQLPPIPIMTETPTGSTATLTPDRSAGESPSNTGN